MILFPAIDLKDGQCVRLLRGDMAEATVFSDDPAGQAAAFIAAGAKWLHIVDLNGAFAGKPVNGAAIEGILAAAAAQGAQVQLGGGIRDLATIEMWLAAGVSRVILGTAAVKDPEMVRQACQQFPGQIVVGVDARGGLVAVEGWAETATLTAVELGRRFEDTGVAAIIFTDIDRDGALEGANVVATAELARSLTTPVIASGGVTSLADLERLKPHEADGIIGVISGRAIYDGRLDLTAALEFLQS
ncbi:MAG: 1-(5-phosphoribosyl)-5-[(5-phosphoribosylamino)methylideneamino]imidazole-4-carboxamide isomerase [Alphaproteobacteria bacterium]|nr:1-(5-phosphoribosyl)-5-[(5-phosphoribosylamino)methylideneamino]imidazole-4-carboxamide isomerase [Alphaproteobacteria bacterium]